MTQFFCSFIVVRCDIGLTEKKRRKPYNPKRHVKFERHFFCTRPGCQAKFRVYGQKNVLENGVYGLQFEFKGIKLLRETMEYVC